MLVLHSYHQGLEWTDNISDGIKSVFSSANHDVEVYFEYLDTKRNTGQRYSAKLIELFRAKSHQIPFDLIITSDNNALEFVRQHRSEFYQQIPIVFCGVNFFNPSLIEGLDNVTGVVEEADAIGTIELMLEVHPKTKKIIVMIDETVTGLAIKESFKHVPDYFSSRVNIEFYTDFTWQQASEYIASLEQGTLIYLLAFNRDKNNKFYSYLDSIDIVNQATRVPVYGSWDFFLGKGIVGGLIISGQEQGRHAAKLALQVLSGTPASDIHILQHVPHHGSFDYTVMQRFNVTEAMLPKHVTILNKPLHVWDQIKTVPIWVRLSMFITVFLMLILLLMLRIRQSIILRSNLSLDRKVRAKTAELEAANTLLQKMSDTDVLTGISNRRSVTTRLSSELSLHQRNKTPLAVIMIDIDFFKKVNDNHGHLFGDEVLQQVAACIQKSVRQGDTVGRYGGEEFLAVLPNTSYRSAWASAERIRDNVASKVWSIPGFRVTLSCGVAQANDQCEDQLLKEADDQLYQAKEDGRNLVR